VGFLTGLVAGGAAVAWGLVVVGSLVRVPVPADARPWLVAAVAVPVLAAEAGALRLSVPQNARQVPQYVTRVPFWGALQFGAELGTGTRTYSPTGLPHVVAVAVLLLASWPEALAAGAGFAAGRALMTLGFLAAGDRSAAARAYLGAVPRLRWLFAGLLAVVLTVLLVP
jgi:hypothetical protein